VFFLSSFCFAQLSRNDSRINDAFTDLTNRIKPTKNFENLKGSPYFDSEFKEASLTYFGTPLKEKVFLRYNAVSDEMEMSLSSLTKETDQALIKNSKVFCEIEGKVYKYLPLNSGNSHLASMGYVKEIYKGKNYSLYLREQKIFREGKKARTSLERSFPPRFARVSEWYFQKEEGQLQFLKPTKRSLKNYFKTDLVHLETFLKSKKGDFKKVNYMEQMIRYLDEIN
jgi:hypothetical protein